jgi:selenide,water dikinase
VCVVGGGAGGIELAMSMHWRLSNLLKKLGKPVEWLEVSIYTRSKTVRIFPAFSRLAAARNRL